MLRDVRAVAAGRLDERAVLANVGLRIAEMRERQGMTQAQLAMLLGVEPRNAQRLEQGANLTLSTLVRVANALGVEPREFFRTTRRAPRGPGRPVRRK